MATTLVPGTRNSVTLVNMMVVSVGSPMEEAVVLTVGSPGGALNRPTSMPLIQTMYPSSMRMKSS